MNSVLLNLKFLTVAYMFGIIGVVDIDGIWKLEQLILCFSKYLSQRIKGDISRCIDFQHGRIAIRRGG